MPDSSPDFFESTSTDTEAPPDERSAFESMVRLHYGRLCAFAFRLLGSRDEASDIVHEVLLRLWRDRHRFDFHESLPYLYRAVRNQVISQQRRTGVRRRALGRRVDDTDLPARESDATSNIEVDELARAAERAIASLPERCRLVYTMRREQGLSYAEIAYALDLAPKTVENHMTRAAKLLRARLRDYLSVAIAVVSSSVW